MSCGCQADLLLETSVPDESTLRSMLRRRSRIHDQAVHSERGACGLPDIKAGTDEQVQTDNTKRDRVPDDAFDAALFQIAIRRAEPGTVLLPARGNKPSTAIVTLAGDAMVSAHYRLGKNVQ